LIRSHPHWCAGWLQAEYRSKYPESIAPSIEAIQAEQEIAHSHWIPDKYDESSTFTDAGDHSKDGDYLGGGSVFNGPVRGYEGEIFGIREVPAPPVPELPWLAPASA
jgi:hypothetical protein